MKIRAIKVIRPLAITLMSVFFINQMIILTDLIIRFLK